MRSARRARFVSASRRNKRAGLGFLTGKPLNVSAPARERLSETLTTHVERMARAVHEGLADIHRGQPAGDVAFDASISDQTRALLQAMLGRFEVVFEKLAPAAAERWANDINRASAAGLNNSLREIGAGLTINSAAMTAGITDTLQASIASNVALIKTIPEQYFQRIQNTVYQSIQQGKGLADVFTDVDKIGAVTQRRALLIARDQTSKATTAINVARMKANKIRKFEWLHSQGSRHPRPLHIGELNGRIFEIAKPPIIDENTGERGFPGQLIECGCRMIPVIEFGATDDDDAEENGS